MTQLEVIATGWGAAANGYLIPFLSLAEKHPKIKWWRRLTNPVKTAQKHPTVHFEWLNYVVCKFYLNKAVTVAVAAFPAPHAWSRTPVTEGSGRGGDACSSLRHGEGKEETAKDVSEGTEERV